jgi:hypothetical protein
MRQALLVGATSLLLMAGMLGAKAETAPSSDAPRPTLIEVGMSGARASDDAAMFGRLIDNFGADRQFGAPASARDFEARLAQ